VAKKTTTTSEETVAENGATYRARRVQKLLMNEHEINHDDDNDHDENEENEGVEE